MTQLPGSKRVAVLAVASLACAVSTGVVALYILWRSLPPTDGAYGTPFVAFFADPFVLTVWVPLVFGAGVIGGLVAVITLWRTNLLVSVPAVFAVSVGAAALTQGLPFFLSPLVALGSAMLAMQTCYSFARWSAARRSRVQAFGSDIQHIVGRKS